MSNLKRMQAPPTLYVEIDANLTIGVIGVKALYYSATGGEVAVIGAAKPGGVVAEVERVIQALREDPSFEPWGDVEVSWRIALNGPRAGMAQMAEEMQWAVEAAKRAA